MDIADIDFDSILDRLDNESQNEMNAEDSVIHHLEEPVAPAVHQDLDDDGQIEIQLFDDPVEAIEAFEEEKQEVAEEAGEESGMDLDDESFEEAIHIFDDLEDELKDLDLPPDVLPGARNVSVKPKEEERETTWEEDSDHRKFLPYLIEKLRSIPPHSGQTTVGCEKAISYLRKLDKEISRAIQGDEKNSIDEEKAEELRDRIHSYIDQLEEAYDDLMQHKGRKKKKASVVIDKNIVTRLSKTAEAGKEYYLQVEKDGESTLLRLNIEEPTKETVTAFKKEAGHLMTVVDPFLQSITRLLIRAHITQGKNIEEVYNQLNSQYNFTDCEQLSIHEVLLQKGLPIHADLGRIMEKDVSPWDGKNVEFDRILRVRHYDRLSNF